MNILILLLLLLLFSCNYPDIDTVPKFNLKKTIQEKCDFVDQVKLEDKEECESIFLFRRL